MERTEQDWWQMLRGVRDKEWANSLVWLDRVESFPPRLSGGNICVFGVMFVPQRSKSSSPQPSAATASVTVQGREWDGEQGGERGVK